MCGSGGRLMYRRCIGELQYYIYIYIYIYDNFTFIDVEFLDQNV